MKDVRPKKYQPKENQRSNNFKDSAANIFPINIMYEIPNPIRKTFPIALHTIALTFYIYYTIN